MSVCVLLARHEEIAGVSLYRRFFCYFYFFNGGGRVSPSRISGFDEGGNGRGGCLVVSIGVG